MNSLSLYKKKKKKSAEEHFRSNSIFAPRTSFSRRLSSTFTGSEPCNKFMNSSASILGCLAEPRVLDETLASLNDPDTESSGGVATPPRSLKTSSIADLTSVETNPSLLHPNARKTRFEITHAHRENKAEIEYTTRIERERENATLKVVDLERERELFVSRFLLYFVLNVSLSRLTN